MVVLRARVVCCECDLPIDKSQTLLQESFGNRKYMCFDCFRKKKGRTINPGDKIELFCERCKYRFSSLKNTCPYCGQGDRVVSSIVSLGDLI